jgi:hypothetical protein
VNEWSGAVELAAFFVGFLLMDVVVAIGLVVGPYQMKKEMPPWIGVVRRLVVLKREEPNLGSAMYGIALLVMFQIPAIAILQPLSPYPLSYRIVSGLYLCGAGLWFAYLRRLLRRA